MSKLSRRSSVYRAATPVSGHRIRLTARTRHSTSTSAMSAAAGRHRSSQARTGIATIDPANTAHTTVWTVFTSRSAVEGWSTAVFVTSRGALVRRGLHSPGAVGAVAEALLVGAHE